MYRTLTNTTIFGTYDIGRAVSTITFAPECPELRYIELGTMKLHALYPNYFGSNKYLDMVRRIGQGYEIWSTDIEECDLMQRAATFNDAFGATLCMVNQAAQLTDSPSRREKSHLGGGRRRMRTDAAAKTEDALSTKDAHEGIAYDMLDDEASRLQQ